MRIFATRSLLAAALASAALAPSVAAQTLGETNPDPAAVRYDGPPPPVAPAVITRDADGNATIRATRVTTPMQIDGNLDEAFYSQVPAISDFVQVLPEDGAPATEKTEAWIAFDDDNIYVGGRIYESHPESEWVANEMRRDANQLTQNDSFGAAFDTYYDRRNGVFFYVNPLGTRSDIQYTNEGNPNRDWQPIWEAKTGRFEGGWTAEFRIPFKSLRYRPGDGQVWGIQLRRAMRHINEWTYLTKIPRSVTGGGSNGASAVMRVSRWGALVGLETPPTGRTIEAKPYGISSLQTDRLAKPTPYSNDAQADAGLDVKMGVTNSLFADLTVNTDFAQVEVDEQQVNLTRFEISFPEKRDFFLEGRDIYQFAISTASAGGGGGGSAPNLFFSRRIGLEGGKLVPIQAGARLTGKLGSFDVGALGMRTGEIESPAVDPTNFAVLRLRRDVFSRGSIGGLFTHRSVSRVDPAGGSNQAFGIDGNLSFHTDFFVSGFYAATRTAGLTSDDDSYRGTFSYNGDLFGASAAYLRVGDNFNPEVGFLRRKDFREATANVRFSPRPRSELIRRFNFQLGTDYLENETSGAVESREHNASAQVELLSSESFDVGFNNTYELLTENFRIADGVILPPGRYSFSDASVGFNIGAQRRFSGGLSVQHGHFYDGNKTTAGLRGGRLNVNERLTIEPSLSFNWVDLPVGSFRSNLAVTRVNYSFTPDMFLSGLVQYNSGNDTFSTNLRMRWEYRPGSELFLVYTEARDTDVLDRVSELQNRGFTIKLTYLLRM